MTKVSKRVKANAARIDRTRPLPLGEALKVKVHAPPAEVRANEELCSFLAAHLGLPRRSVTVLRGDSSRLKLVRIEGLAEFDVRSRLASVAL